MKSFKEFTEEWQEAFTMQQRIKAKATFKKNKSKIELGRKKAAKKLASPEKLKARAEKQARNMIAKKILKDKDKNDLGFAGRQGLEKQLDKKKGAIHKLATKLLPSIKVADREKLRKNKEDDK
tara:strand:- start:256 stop:624 length:369 start_codon:yes stop_codon:yes gene_type:complete